MAIESATKISELNPLWPLGTDPKSEGDQHIRMLKSVLQSVDGGAVTASRRLVYSSSTTWSKPAGLKFLEVWAVGGGGGSYATSGSPAGQSAASGGGAGGGTAIKVYKASELAATQAVTIGAAGAAEGGTGGSTVFVGLTASGGGGGGANTGPATTLLVSTGGTPGNGTGGDLNISGGFGGQGIRCVHGQPVVAKGGDGGGTWLAPGRPATLATSGAVSAGITGSFPGAGAMGVGVGANGSTTGGAAGAIGGLILMEYT